jgi:uncharacterized protein (TIGR03067 family)
MKRLALLLAAALLAGPTFALSLPDLAGTWVFKSIEADGNPVDDENVLQAEFEIKGDKYTFRMGDNVARGTVKLDTTHTPAWFDLTETEGNNVGNTALGLAEIVPGGWRTALHLQGGSRPDSFSSEGGHILAVYKRKQVSVKPLRGLLITGGCCHDYPGQADILTKGISQRANITWDVVLDPNASGTQHKVSVYEATDWAKKYDVVVHNECYADEKDPAWLERIVKPHRDGVPAVVIHCAMHCYRAKTNEWFKFVGVTSHGHGSHFAYAMTNAAPKHPIMLGFPAVWNTPKEELYNIASVEPSATPLATGWSPETKKAEVNVWVNTYGKTRVFGTTMGHYNQTMQEPLYLDLVARGLLWACDKLTEEGKPAAGYEGH